MKTNATNRKGTDTGDKRPDAGFNAHLVKPVDTEILHELMARTDLIALLPQT